MAKRMTHEEFLEKFEKENPVIFNQVEVLGKYLNRITPLLLNYKYGEIEVTPVVLYKIKRINIAQAKDPTVFFTEQAKEKHNSFYTYKHVKYIKSDKEVVITCSIHGDFPQTPTMHLQGQGCSKCGMVARTLKLRSMDADTFFFRLEKEQPHIFAELTFIGEFKAGTVTILARNKYGEVYVHPMNAIKGHKPNIHSAVNKTLYTIARFEEVHNSLYGYQDVKYTGKDNNVIIHCPIHGAFKMTPNNHIRGEKCGDCCRDNKGGWSRKEYVTQIGNRLSNCYIIKCSNTEEVFYKIGISINVTRRFKGPKSMPYKYEILKLFTDSAGVVFDKEKALQKFHREAGLKYKPKIHFDGATECFSEILWDEINKAVNKEIKE